jgi:hypothetical protein
MLIFRSLLNVAAPKGVSGPQRHLIQLGLDLAVDERSEFECRDAVGAEDLRDLAAVVEVVLD